MANESGARRRVCEILRREGLNPVAIENTIARGTPDINYVEGWIEIKVLDAWPKRETTLVQIRHFTEHQRNWIRHRARAGGRVFFLLKIEEGREWYLFDGRAAIDNVGGLTTDELKNLALASWRIRIDGKELAACLNS